MYLGFDEGSRYFNSLTNLRRCSSLCKLIPPRWTIRLWRIGYSTLYKSNVVQSTNDSPNFPDVSIHNLKCSANHLSSV